MKKTFLALLLAAGATATLSLAALAQDEGIMKPTYALLRHSLAARSAGLRTTIASDSTFVGHSHTDHTAGGTNPWNIYVGTSRPGINPANSAIWDFDDQTGFGTVDSLQGWWPNRFPYRYAPISTMSDNTRPWYAVDHGNQANYRPINGRTFGVTGIWHADPGNGGASPLVRWHPLAGSRSMWCGLRALNDNSVIDPVTHQPYNEQATQNSNYAGNTSAAPIFRNYPGYGNSWDQILYRDFQAVSGNAMEIKFLYRTAMSVTISTGITTATGWFHGDPLSMSAGNFISANGPGAVISRAPRDSFSVYIGCPVNDASCAYTDPSVSGSPVYDKQRRWFDEVIRFDAPYFEILGQAGSVGDSTAAVSVDQVIPWASPGNGNAYVSALYNASGNAAHRVRLAFRVKTNRTFSDDDYKSGSGVVNGGYTSNGVGAAQIDNVSVNNFSDPSQSFDFEAADGGVDNALDGSGNWVTDPSLCWKSTGKPPANYFHPVDVNAVTWNDICGLPHSPTSECNLAGIVVSVGNADQGGAIADGRWPSTTEYIGGFVSPTIDLVTNPDGVTPNEMGITGNMKQGTDDYCLQYEVNFAAFVLGNTGTLWTYACQSYPALTANGHNAWSDLIGQPGRIYNTYAGCQPDLESIKSNGMIHTSNASGIPDSMRVMLYMTTECFYFGGDCNSAPGGYFDDISVVITNRLGTDPVGAIASDIWQFFNDAFPVNGYSLDGVPAGSAAFDTTTALIKGAINIASSTGDANRFDVLADSITVSAPNGTGVNPFVRVDLIFRILPGPGNYKNTGSLGRAYPPTTTMQLLRVPTDPSTVISAGDKSFWSEYIANDGQFGSSAGAGHPSGPAFASRWDHLHWNSARCDTVEANEFPVSGKASSGVDPNGNTYQTTYHESDPHYESLGIPKGICFLIDPTGVNNSTNISCDTTFTKVPGHLVGNWELAATSGFNGRFSTKEFTKIIPDGLLTPGSHVQYFFRKQRADLTGSFAMDPDTTNISPQLSEGNFDGHRWQQFGVLPDRWKDPAYNGGGAACMLYIDNDDRRGDERVWVSMMDSIGGTASSKWGAHNGWHAPGAGFGLFNQSNPGIASAFVQRNAQPGTLWDMYGVKASESAQTSGTHIGNRYAVPPTGFMTGKGASIGPRKEWLRTYYRWVSWFTGDLSLANIGPIANIGEDDIGLIEDFLTGATGTSQPRGLFIQGEGFAEQCDADGGPQTAFLNNYLFCGLRDVSYTDLTPSLVTCPDLTVDPVIVPAGTVYGVVNNCATLNDVLDPGGSENTVAASYQAVGVNAPYRAGIEHAASGAHNWHSIINGWDMANTCSRYCATSNGRLSYYYNVMANVFGTLCGSDFFYGGPTLDVPNNQHGGLFVNFMKVGNSAQRTSNTTVNFGVEHAGRVRVRLYDVTGRVVRTLTDRTYEAGDHAASWDGRDDSGNALARGVYFARIEFATGAPINGRVVLLR